MLDIIIDALTYVIALVLYYGEVILCKLLDILYSMFEVFAGITTVKYDGNQQYLINVFFNNETISYVFWGMAAVSIALTFAFAIVATVKKLFDTNEKVKNTYGQILTGVFKSILIICLLTAIISVVITATNMLMQSITQLFKDAEASENPTQMEFTDEDYACMFRIMDTVANYSLNTTYNNTYNLNACFNDIRGDLQILQTKGIFKLKYESKAYPENWQRSLRSIAMAGDIEKDHPLDEYDAAISNALIKCMAQLKTNEAFKPLASPYVERPVQDNNIATLGKTILIASSFNAARNDEYNKNQSVTDNLRADYYYGVKDIYDLGDVEDSFKITLTKWNHLIAIAAILFLAKTFAAIIFNCIARIFNMLLLYIMGPPFIAVIPLDDGEKLKQWITAFTIQSLGVFGTVVSIRVMIMFIPIILSSRLEMFSDPLTNIMAKVALVVGAGFTCEKAGEMISGILANNAGMQSLMAGNIGAQAVGATMAVGKSLGAVAGKAALATAKAADSVTGLSAGLKKLDSKALNLAKLPSRLKDNGGIAGSIYNAATGKGFLSDTERKQKKEEEKEQQQSDMAGDMKALREKLVGPRPENGNNNNSNKNNSTNSNTNNNTTPPPSANADYTAQNMPAQSSFEQMGPQTAPDFGADPQASSDEYPDEQW